MSKKIKVFIVFKFDFNLYVRGKEKEKNKHSSNKHSQIQYVINNVEKNSYKKKINLKFVKQKY